MTNTPRARDLHFSSFDDLLADARRIAEHPDAPTQGQWTAAQNLWHVARYVQASVEGYPFTSPWWMKLLGPLLKKKMVNQPMASGFDTPANVKAHMEPGGTSAEDTTMPAALAKLESWVGKARAQGFIDKNPVFGRMSARQWEQLHCRHAELHFGMITLPG